MNAVARRRKTPPTPSLTDILRDADWLTARRARDYALMLLALSVVTAIIWGGLAIFHHGLDPIGKPLGTDYPSFWAASRLALDHMPGAAYDPPLHWAVQRAAFSGAPVGYSAFFYPPPYLLACLPLALLPYLPSLGLWLAATGGAMVAALRPLLLTRASWLALAAYPAVLTTLGHGQNALLTTALFAGGLLCVATRPILGGVLIGLLVIKPHLGLVLPVALLAAGRWRAIAAAAVTLILACALSAGVFGVDIWTDFLQASPLARQALEQNLVGDGKMQSLFAAVRVLGGPLILAWTLQVAMSLGVTGVLFREVRRTRDVAAQASLAACAALLASPFLLDYDLMLGVLPLLWLLREGTVDGFRPWEKSVMLAAFVLPLVSRRLATSIHLPLAPLVLSALFAVVISRARRPALQLR